MSPRSILLASSTLALGCSSPPEDPCGRYPSDDLYAACTCIQEEQAYLEALSLGCCDEGLFAFREATCRAEQAEADTCVRLSQPDTESPSHCDTATPACDVLERCATAACTAPNCDAVP